ncbi:hypothetical protein [Phytohabitans rumicis]|uniref:Uncharacterized protein n=1 Tax=Phytohabitans rumicis TaxID=1076125 RepID=A0A6V8LL42_9ACTN|nr:hypothetical protein [Phytohabitans rumicis]GFJ95359.1 hypothetical protein Prum_090010 [Phytohabitans rumicis]
MSTGPAGLVAVGHYLGAFPTHDGRWRHEIRRGPEVEELTEAEAGAWAGPGDPTHRPYTLDRLVDRGLLVPVSWDDGADFARGHRLLPLLYGLGPDPDAPDRCHIGTFGRPVVTVDRLGYDLWAEAAAHPSLWHACRRYATAGGPGPNDPHAVLVALLERLDTLTAAGAACLDLAVPADPGAGTT